MNKSNHNSKITANLLSRVTKPTWKSFPILPQNIKPEENPRSKSLPIKQIAKQTSPKGKFVWKKNNPKGIVYSYKAPRATEVEIELIPKYSKLHLMDGFHEPIPDFFVPYYSQKMQEIYNETLKKMKEQEKSRQNVAAIIKVNKKMNCHICNVRQIDYNQHIQTSKHQRAMKKSSKAKNYILEIAEKYSNFETKEKKCEKKLREKIKQTEERESEESKIKSDHSPMITRRKLEKMNKEQIKRQQ